MNAERGLPQGRAFYFDAKKAGYCASSDAAAICLRQRPSFYPSVTLFADLLEGCGTVQIVQRCNAGDRSRSPPKVYVLL